MNPSESSADRPPRQRTEPLPGLDILRILAAVMITLLHLSWWEWAQFKSAPSDLPVFPVIGRIFANGFIGVEIFFVLSGFVIAFSANGSSFWPFLRSRFTRLYPAIWICTTITVFVGVVFNAVPFHVYSRSWLLNALLLPPAAARVDSVYWTLNLEVAFYLIIALLLAARRIEWMQHAMGLLSITSCALWTLSLLVERAVLTDGRLVAFTQRFQYGKWSQSLLLQHGCFFAAGVFLWLILIGRPTTARLVLLAVATLGGSIEIYFHARELQSMTASAPGWQLPLAGWLLSLCAMVASVRWNTRISNALGKRGLHAVRVLAMVTYPLYLLHQSAGYTVMRIWYRALPARLCLLLVFLLATVTAWLVHRFAELPLQKLLRHLLHSKARRALPATTVP